MTLCFTAVVAGNASPHVLQRDSMRCHPRGFFHEEAFLQIGERDVRVEDRAGGATIWQETHSGRVDR